MAGVSYLVEPGWSPPEEEGHIVHCELHISLSNSPWHEASRSPASTRIQITLLSLGYFASRDGGGEG